MSYIQIYPKESQIENEAYPMPWRSDACCYNFHTPEIFIPDDRINDMITDPLDEETLVVTSDLEDYSFISDMKNLTQLYLYNARHLWDISIFKELVKLRQICIMNSKVICLDGLNALLVNKKKASKAMSDDFNARITYGIEGIYIHSDESDQRITHIYTYGIYIGELDIHPYRGVCFDPPEEEDIENINPIKRQKYHVWDGTNRTLPANPKVKYVRDFDDLIDRLEYATDTIFDLLWLYNISGLIVEKVVNYQDPESDFGIRVAFTIFGTYVKENDTDEYYPEAETGPYNLGNTSDWNSETDLSMWMEETRSMKYLKKDVRKFYDTTGLNLD